MSRVGGGSGFFVSKLQMNMTRVVLVCILSAGWLLPLCISVRLFLFAYVPFTLLPQITGRGFLASWSALEPSYWLFVVSASWLACAIIFWTAYFLRTIGVGRKV
jgi:hypothetical protein